MRPRRATAPKPAGLSDRELFALARAHAMAPWQYRLVMGLAALILAGEPLMPEQLEHLQLIARQAS